MLDLMRRYKTWIQPVLWLVIISFVAYYGVLDRDSAGGGMVAEVNGKKITYDKYREQLAGTENSIRNALKENADEYIARINLKGIVLNNLINKAVMYQIAEEMGIKASDLNLIERLKTYDAFKDSAGNIDENQMIAILKRNRIDPKAFVEDQKREIVFEKLKEIIEDSAVVSDAELWNEYVEENEKIEALYCYYPPDFFKFTDQINEPELRQYFSKNFTKYVISESADVEYVLISLKDIEDGVTISEKQAMDFYNANQDDYKAADEEVKARHILFSIQPGAKPDEEEIIKKKALKVLDEAKKGKSFEALAQLYSDEPLATATGGDLGFFRKGEMEPEFEKTAFSMSEGEISGPVKTTYGYHIIKVEKKLSSGDVKPFEYVKQEVTGKVKRNEVKTKALAKANEMRKQWVENKSADEMEIKPVRKKIFRDKAIEDVERSGELFDAAYSLKNNEISQPVRLGSSYAVIKLINKAPRREAKFEEVKSKVEQDCRNVRQLTELDSHIKDIVARLNSGEDLYKIASEEKVEVKATGLILRSDVPADTINRSGFTAAMFSLNENRKAGYTINPGLGTYILVLKDREPAMRDEFESKKDAMRRASLQSIRELVSDRVIASFKKKGVIKVNSEFQQFL